MTVLEQPAVDTLARAATDADAAFDVDRFASRSATPSADKPTIRCTARTIQCRSPMRMRCCMKPSAAMTNPHSRAKSASLMLRRCARARIARIQKRITYVTPVARCMPTREYHHPVQRPRPTTTCTPAPMRIKTSRIRLTDMALPQVRDVI
jgi:hypothetical protein